MKDTQRKTSKKKLYELHEIIRKQIITIDYL